MGPGARFVAVLSCVMSCTDSYSHIAAFFNECYKLGPLPPHGPTGSDSSADATVCSTKDCNQPPPPPGVSRSISHTPSARSPTPGNRSRPARPPLTGRGRGDDLLHLSKASIAPKPTLQQPVLNVFFQSSGNLPTLLELTVALTSHPPARGLGPSQQARPSWSGLDRGHLPWRQPREDRLLFCETLQYGRRANYHRRVLGVRLAGAQ
jgi:hypothetical protein